MKTPENIDTLQTLIKSLTPVELDFLENFAPCGESVPFSSLTLTERDVVKKMVKIGPMGIHKSLTIKEINLMRLKLKVTSSVDYFSHLGQEINWDSDNPTDGTISVSQADLVGEILATEISIFLLRSSTGFCGSLIDHMGNIRETLIEKYESLYGDYHCITDDIVEDTKLFYP